MGKQYYQLTLLPSNKTRVVHLKRTKGVIVQDCDIYIGRQCTMGGWNLPRSKWANPFRLGEKGYETVDSVLKAYENHILARKHLKDSLHELKGKVLGCKFYP